MSTFKRCYRLDCGKPAVTTLTYAYVKSTAVMRPLTAVFGPHSWDPCEKYARSITAPLGWELMRYDVPMPVQGDGDLTALTEVVREASCNVAGLVLQGKVDNRPQTYKINSSRYLPARKPARGHLHVVHDPKDSDD